MIRGQQRGSDGIRRPDVERAQLPSVGILIVDDDEDTRDMIAVLLERGGFSTLTAANGREALAILERIRPQLILLDVCMPVMDGAQFRAEQRHHREWLDIPTIVMTGEYDEPMLDVAIEQTLQKPVRGAALLALAEHYCTKRESQ